MEAVQSWRAEKESRLSGEKQQEEEEEEEESIYTIHNEQVNCPFTTRSPSANINTSPAEQPVEILRVW